MKALSIRQPWAWWIVNGPKRVENRTWATKYRGPVLIHAGKAWHNNVRPADPAYLAQLDAWMEQRCILAKYPRLGRLPRDPEAYLTGGIVGRARIVDCIDGNHPRSRDPFSRGHSGSCWRMCSR